jgi:hypothetical protein
MRYSEFQKIKDRYERMSNWGSDTAGMTQACAIAYSIDVPVLIAEVEHLNRQIEDRASRVGESA